MKVVILDYETLGLDLDLSVFDKYGKIAKYPTSSEIEAKTSFWDGLTKTDNKNVILRWTNKDGQPKNLLQSWDTSLALSMTAQKRHSEMD